VYCLLLLKLFSSLYQVIRLSGHKNANKHIKSNQIYLPTQNMKEKTDEKPEVNQNEKNKYKI